MINTVNIFLFVLCSFCGGSDFEWEYFVPELLLVQRQWPASQNHVISMRSVSDAVVLMDLKYAVAVYCIEVNDLDSISPSVLL